jgi:DNA-binding NarL/FixJ family response regulator
MLVEIYPPSLQRAGLPAALQDLVAPLEGRGVAATLVVPEVVPAGRQTAEIVFRVAQEALRNVIAHSKANSVELTVALHDDWLVLTVTDDGIGFEPDALAAALAGGHVGLRLLRDLSQSGGRNARCDVRTGRGHKGSTGGTTRMIRVLLVDDHKLVRAGLQSLLATVDDIQVVGVAASGCEALGVATDTGPEVVLMDLSMPGMGGVEATRQLLERMPSVQVVMLTSFADQELVLQAIEAGAVGYLLKDAEPEDLVRGVRAAAKGESPLSGKVARALLTRRPPPPPPPPPPPKDMLTDREREVLSLVAYGLPNKQIAARMDITEGTVKAHLTSVYQRIGVADRTQAALWARRNGLVDDIG